MVKKILIVVVAFLVGCLAQYNKINRPKTKTAYEPIVVIENGTTAIRMPTIRHRHVVALTVGPMVQSYFCGGSLVSQRTVLTAAHCIDTVFIDGALASTLRAVTGTYTWRTGGQTSTIDRNITHPNFHRESLKNDIGLLITTSDVVLSIFVQPISLSYDVIPSGVMGEVAGWGKLGTDKEAPDDLQEIQVPTISTEECNEKFIPFRNEPEAKNIPQIDTTTQICTFYSKGSGFCMGDSGSALTQVSDGRQIGVVSWGILCARGAPDVFSRISGYADWLKKNIV